MFFPMDSYGMGKRLQFLQKTIESFQPDHVLDIGCGTGTYVSFPLAKCFPNIRFIGMDADAASIEFARSENSLPNLFFVYPEELNQSKKFDLIIASEVIEHVECPDKFLLYLGDRLNEKGKLALTLPNGYGPFEL